MTESVRIVLEEGSQTAEARRAARHMADILGFSEIHKEQVSIVVTEACTNMVKYGVKGEIVLRVTGENTASTPALEMIALDSGPGMNVEQCMQDGFSTGSSPGQGMGAIARLAPISDFYSLVSKGSAVLARWPGESTARRGHEVNRPLLVGVVNLPKHGESVSGDAWGVEHFENHSVFIVADGLGHGVDAHAASNEAVRIFHLHADLPPKALIERVHLALRSSRGAAVAVARVDRAKGKLTYCGAGNISGQIYSLDGSSRHLVSVNGTAGHQIQALREFEYEWPEDGVLVLNSDGLSTRAGLDAYPRLRSRDASLIAGILYRDFSRGHDDSTVVIAKAA